MKLMDGFLGGRKERKEERKSAAEWASKIIQGISEISFIALPFWASSLQRGKKKVL